MTDFVIHTLAQKFRMIRPMACLNPKPDAQRMWNQCVEEMALVAWIHAETSNWTMEKFYQECGGLFDDLK